MNLKFGAISHRVNKYRQLFKGFGIDGKFPKREFTDEAKDICNTFTDIFTFIDEKMKDQFFD